MFLGSALGLLGGWDKPLEALIFFMVLDYVAAVVLALRNRRWSSSVGASGIFRKLALLVAVAFAFGIDRYLQIGTTPLLRTTLAMWFALNEAGSAAANLALLGVPMPTFITDALRREIERKAPAPLPEATASGGV